MNRVVLTGLGAVTPIGNNVPDYWEALITGQGGIGLIDCFDTSKFSTKIAAQVKNMNFADHFEKKEIRRTSRFVCFAMIAAKEAVADAGLEITDKNAHSIGVEIGSGIGGIAAIESACEILRTTGKPSKLNPFTIPMMIPDMAAGQLAIKLGAKGPNAAAVTACASAGHAIMNAYSHIQSGSASAVIAGGTEACITPVAVAAFCAARSLSTRNDNPSRASRPFNLDRDGFVMGEGSGIVVLESLDHARARGAKIYAELVGCGNTCDAYHITAPEPSGDGGMRALKIALKMGNIKPSEVDYINAHGTSTKLNDKVETLSIKKALGEEVASGVNISSTKSMTGHLLGAAGGIELIAAVKAMEKSIIPPTINYETPDPECDLNITPNKAVERTVNVALSTSLGFGGHNAVLAIRKMA